jgi:hypothetical protein
LVNTQLVMQSATWHHAVFAYAIPD